MWIMAEIGYEHSFDNPAYDCDYDDDYDYNTRPPGADETGEIPYDLYDDDSSKPDDDPFTTPVRGKTIPEEEQKFPYSIHGYNIERLRRMTVEDAVNSYYEKLKEMG